MPKSVATIGLQSMRIRPLHKEKQKFLASLLAADEIRKYTAAFAELIQRGYLFKREIIDLQKRRIVQVKLSDIPRNRDEIEIVLKVKQPATGFVKISQEFLNSRKQVAEKDETLPNYLISRDAKTSVLYAKVKPAIVNYKKVIADFMTEGLSDTNRGSFLNFLYKHDHSMGADDESLEALEEDEASENNAGSGELGKLREVRNQYWRSIIKKISTKEAELKNAIELCRCNANY